MAELCATCLNRPDDLDAEQRRWHHTHCRDGCPGHWVHDDDVTEQRCGEGER